VEEAEAVVYKVREQFQRDCLRAKEHSSCSLHHKQGIAKLMFLRKLMESPIKI
jgi:hypothetical protein